MISCEDYNFDIGILKNTYLFPTESIIVHRYNANMSETMLVIFL